MSRTCVAFLWHHHQPYYTDDLACRTPLPWVRLHAIKDYTGMALHLKNAARVKGVFNFVPSLLKQLNAISDEKCRDYYYDLSSSDTASLGEADVNFIIKNFFSANWETMVNPHPRYRELLEKTRRGARPVESSRKKFSAADLRDLVVWFNLAWFHPLVVRGDDFLKSLLDKGRDFSEDDKRMLLDKQIETVRGVIPLYRELLESRRIEISTSPFYHPILPLLLDMHSAHEAMPGTTLPSNHASLAADAAAQIDRGIELHEKTFGSRPAGMWPPEGSVSSAIVKPLAERGIKWAASDEDVLVASLGKGGIRRGYRHLSEPQTLYKPYIAASGDSEIAVVFRDHAVSNAIGFEYQRTGHKNAVDDFFRYLSQARKISGDRPPLVPVILDGENAWEYYSEGGVPFLEELYRRLDESDDVETVTISEYIEKYPPEDRLPKLFAGSWINGNFYTWIGHSEDVKAWETVFDARKTLEQAEKEGAADAGKIAAAREEIYIAEGSDWYWWFGDDHSSAHDDVFDDLFRSHVRNVYEILGKEPPPELARPIKELGASLVFDPPRSLLNVVVDGRVSNFFEWMGAGHYNQRRAQGAMENVGQSVDCLYFGFSMDTFFIRLDFDRSDPARSLPDAMDCRIVFLSPGGKCLDVHADVGGDKGKIVVRSGEEDILAELDTAVYDRIFEASCPFELIGVEPEMLVEFFVELRDGEKTMERIPGGNPLYFKAPGDDFEGEVWL